MFQVHFWFFQILRNSHGCDKLNFLAVWQGFIKAGLVVVSLIGLFFDLREQLFLLLHCFFDGCLVIFIVRRFFFVFLLDFLDVEIFGLCECNSFEVKLDCFDDGEEFWDEMGVFTDLGKDKELADELNFAEALNNFDSVVVLTHANIITMTSIKYYHLSYFHCLMRDFNSSE